MNRISRWGMPGVDRLLWVSRVGGYRIECFKLYRCILCSLASRGDSGNFYLTNLL